MAASGSCAAGAIVAKFRAVKSTSFARRALAVLSVGFGLYSLSSPPPTATAQTRNASQKLEAIREESRELAATNAALLREVNALRTDVSAVEDRARADLGMVYPDEVVLRVRRASTP